MFVNHLGQPIDIESMKKSAPKGKRAAATAEQYHKGWRAVGYSPAHLEEAKRAYEKEREDAARGGRDMPPWSVEMHMRRHPPKPIRSKPYELQQAAEAACELARKEGWIGCRPVVVAKL